MNAHTLLPLLSVSLFLAGCAGPDVNQLRLDNRSLAAELSASQAAARELEARNRDLGAELEAQRAIGTTLMAEKGYRQADSTGLRREARLLLKKQMKIIREFAVSSALLDYVGGEPIPRDEADGKNVLLADLQNRIPGDGAVMEGRLLARGPMTASFCLLRPEGKSLMVVWVGRPFSVAGEGLVTNVFDETVGVKKGDVIALHCPQEANVPFSRGIGRTRLFSGRVQTGQAIPIGAFTADGPRMYSFGVAGLL
mgnify:FL=1